MSRIFISLWSNTVPGYYNGPFFEGLIRSLIRNGNQVLVSENNKIFGANRYHENSNNKWICNLTITNIIKEFDPELVIAFNNSLLDGLDKILDCPIIQWFSDSIFYAANVDYLKQNHSRYKLLCFAKCQINDIHKAFNIPKKNIFYVPPCTDFFPLTEKQGYKYDVSYISSCFYSVHLSFWYKILLERGYKKDFTDLINSYFKKPNLDFKSRISGYSPDCQKALSSCDITDSGMLNLLSHHKRATILNSLTEFKLGFFGSDGWNDLFAAYPLLISQFDKKLIITMQDNQKIYNNSLINLNISHQQSRGSLPFRICDVMSSNGMLLSDELSEAKDALGQDVFIPTYKNEKDVYDKCVYYFKNEKERKEIVSTHQQLIAKFHKFENRFHDIEKITNLNLLNNDDPQTDIKLISTKQAKVNSEIKIGKLYEVDDKAEEINKILYFIFYMVPDSVLWRLKVMLKKMNISFGPKAYYTYKAYRSSKRNI